MMNIRGNVLVIGVVIVVALISAAAWSGWPQRVRWVDDGDTIVLSNGTRVRYIGLDAPEIAHKNRKGEPYGREAKAFNKQLVYGKTVRLELDREQHDQYGRLLAYVYLDKGMLVNEALLKGGYAHYVYRAPNTAHDRRFLLAQREAMAKRLGLWRRFPNTPGPFLGNKRSKRFHRPRCRYGKATANRHAVSLKDRYTAFWEGYSPCAKCMP